MASQPERTMGHSDTLFAINEISKSVERIADRQEKQNEKIDTVLTAVNSIDKKVAILESKEIIPQLEGAQKRLSNVEQDLSTWKTRVYTVIALVGFVWAFFADMLKSWVMPNVQ